MESRSPRLLGDPNKKQFQNGKISLVAGCKHWPHASHSCSRLNSIAVVVSKCK